MAAKRDLTSPKILRAALELADKEGLKGLSMRKLANQLKVEAMSLYHYFRNKEQILDAMVDQVFVELLWNPETNDWRQAMLERAESLRQSLHRHPWALGLLESRRNPGPGTLGHHDAVLGKLRRAGFSIELAAHTYALLDSYIYGFVLQEQSLPGDHPEELRTIASQMLAAFPAKKYPHLFEMTSQHFTKADYAFADEFRFGLNLILDGLEKIQCEQSTNSM